MFILSFDYVFCDLFFIFYYICNKCSFSLDERSILSVGWVGGLHFHYCLFWHFSNFVLVRQEVFLQ